MRARASSTVSFGSTSLSGRSIGRMIRDTGRRIPILIFTEKTCEEVLFSKLIIGEKFIFELPGESKKFNRLAIICQVMSCLLDLKVINSSYLPGAIFTSRV